MQVDVLKRRAEHLKVGKIDVACRRPGSQGAKQRQRARAACFDLSAGTAGHRPSHGGRQAGGLGLAALGRPAYITSGREEDLPDRSMAGLRTRTFSMLDAAYAAGVRYVDAARSYGRAEEFLAGWLAERGPADVIVGSKWGYRYTGGWRLDAAQQEVKDHSLAMFTTQLAQSRALLGDRLTLYQVHSLTLDSGLFTDAALLAALSRLRAEGVIIGLSASGPHQADTIRRALSLTVDGQQLFTAAEVTWNLLEPSAGPAAAEAAAAGWAVLVKEAVANGRLTPAGDRRRR